MLIEYVKPNIILVLCSIAISIIGLFGSKFAVIDLFRWEQALFCVPAFVLGYLFKDKWREKYYNYFTFSNWGVASNYHLCLDSSLIGVEGCADFIIDFARKCGKLK